MIGLWGAGSVIGSLAGRRLKPSNEARWLVLGTGLVSMFALAVALSPWFLLPVVGPKGMYAILAVTAFLSAIVILPILRLDRPETSPGLEGETPVLHAPVVPGDPVA